MGGEKKGWRLKCNTGGGGTLNSCLQSVSRLLVLMTETFKGCKKCMCQILGSFYGGCPLTQFSKLCESILTLGIDLSLLGQVLQRCLAIACPSPMFKGTVSLWRLPSKIWAFIFFNCIFLLMCSASSIVHLSCC